MLGYTVCMSMITRFLLLFCLFFHTACFADTLADRFLNAEAGDFAVIEQGKQMTVLYIAQKKDNALTIEEISAPYREVPSWQKWLDDGALGYTSWTATTLDLSTGKVLSIFSRASGKWVKNESLFSFLPTLLKCTLTPVPQSEQKRIGPSPMAGEEERRKLWYPKIIVNGKEVANTCSVFQTKWPNDASELSNKTITLYIPQAAESLKYFPYWIQVSGKIGKVKLRVIDSGKGLKTAVMNRENNLIK